ncbi:MAG: LL-diaminopimelate aminotransferase [Rickettsiales bacterium]|jgi:LL-diaminopimelate aminotransferase|nr:LL-diaminopimelate aminotransferase [Rickettsiales bacterium]
MIKINDNFLKLPKNYLFAEIANRVKKYMQENPQAKVIKLGIGDVTRPLAPSIVKAMKDASEEMGTENGFKGYPDYEGYDFLREALVNDFAEKGTKIGADEIFVSDGAKSDSANISEIFATDSIIAVSDPVYPVYVDSNALAGRLGVFDETKRRWSKVIYMDATKENNFVPSLPTQKADLIYLCFPNNPTGAVATKEKLQKFVDYANVNGSVIIFDGAYEAYITEKDIPHSIYECDGARTCAIELRSFSKDAGFTGTRCAYVVIPNELVMEGQQIKNMWLRRQATKFNGVSYVTQKGAAARFSAEGKKEVNEILAYYKANANTIYKGLKNAGLEVFGAVNSPYIWLKTPKNMASWDFFDFLLKEVNVVGTPGSGFGTCGEGYFRLTSFASAVNTEEAVKRIVSKL